MSLTPQVSWLRDARRVALAGVGIVFVGVGWVGVFLPGLPATGPLIIASYCFARSCPWLEGRLLRLPVFATYMRIVDDGRGLSKRAALGALASMWTSVGVSLVTLSLANRLTPLLGAIIVFSAGVGSAVIGYYARTTPPRGGLEGAVRPSPGQCG